MSKRKCYISHTQVIEHQYAQYILETNVRTEIESETGYSQFACP